jgi:hypothetical protein
MEIVSHMKPRVGKRAMASTIGPYPGTGFPITRTPRSQANLRQFNRLREPSTARR